MSTRVNIILFGVDRCPDLCRPGLESFLSGLCDCADIYIGLISLGQEGSFKNEQRELKNWASDIKGRNLFWNVRIGQTFNQANPGSYGNRELLDRSLSQCMARLDIFYNGYESIRNYMNYLYYSYCFSKQIACLVEDYPTLLLRPDMLYGGLTTEHFKRLIQSIVANQSAAYVLSHDSFGFANDRFMASNPQNVIAYMQRIGGLNRYLSWPWRYFHSEKYALWVIQRRLNLQVHELPVSFWGKRVRPNAQVLEDCNLLNRASEKQIYAKMFARHSCWQLKLSLKKFMTGFRPL